MPAQFLPPVLKPLYCSFCGKQEDETQALVKGPQVFICDGCLEICDQITAQIRGCVDGEMEYLSWLV
jgi:ClpX C4-type zinc finger